MTTLIKLEILWRRSSFLSFLSLYTLAGGREHKEKSTFCENNDPLTGSDLTLRKTKGEYVLFCCPFKFQLFVSPFYESSL